MKTRTAIVLLWLLCLCAGAGCTTVAKVVEKRPVLKVTQSAASALVSVEYRMLKALRIQERDPMAALGVYIDAAKIASEHLAADPADGEALRDYNFAVARIVSTVETAELAPWTDPVAVSGGPDGSDYVLTHLHDPRKSWDPARYHFSPSDQFELKGTYVRNRTLRPGIGAPTVATARELNPAASSVFLPDRIYYGVTAIVRFKGRTCELAFEDPLHLETTRVAGRTLPLAADFTVPLAAMLEDDANNPKKLNFSRYFNPGKYDDTARITRLEPYDPDKTVVLVIHGLTSSQATWTPLINTLRGDADIRRNFQFWFFSYPSGYPYPYSAMMLRRELDRAGQVFDLQKPMVVLGHSMGGCISRLLITDSGDQLWEKVFNRTPEETALSEAGKALFTEALIFDHRDEVGRVVFLSSPLKGSEIAQSWLGRIGGSLVRTPKALLDIGRDAVDLVNFQQGDLRVKYFPDSVDTLAPNSRFVKAINQVPITAGIPHHVIAGDRGRGDAPESSDGVVPYWSTHMETAHSEKIVPSGHGSHQHPEGISEVSRILKLHAKNTNN